MFKIIFTIEGTIWKKKKKDMAYKYIGIVCVYDIIYT